MKIGITMNPTRATVLAEANPILAAYNGYAQFEIRNSKLYLVCETKALPVRLNSDASTLGMNYHHFGMGGTQAYATGQLVRWIRGATRLPLQSWRYWTGPTCKLGGRFVGGCDGLMRMIEESSYPDPDKTKCVICGTNEIMTLDWWSSPTGVVGPCCTFGTCETEEQKRIRLEFDRKRGTGRASA